MMIALYVLSILAATLYLMASFAFFKCRDVFMMLQIVTICNFYIIPLILLAAELEKFSIVSFVKILIVIGLNFIATQLLCHAIGKEALRDKIRPDADFKK